MRVQQARVETERVQGNGRPHAGPHATEGPYKDTPISELVRNLSQDTATLVRQETELFKTEMNARVHEVQRTASVLGVGAAIAWFGAMALTAALILGLAEIMPGWVAALIVGAAYVIAGGIALMVGKQRLSEQELKPEQTTRSVKTDIRVMREAAR